LGPLFSDPKIRGDWPEGCWPTPGQLFLAFQRLSPTAKVEFMEQVIDSTQRADRCLTRHSRLEPSQLVEVPE
jgi:hypothetical protein